VSTSSTGAGQRSEGVASVAARSAVVEGVLPCEGDGVVLAIFLEDEIAYLMSEGVLRPEDASLV
jgi:hypothetical protein